MAATAVDGADEALGKDGAPAASPSTPEATALKVLGDVMMLSEDEEESPDKSKGRMDETPSPGNSKKDKDTPEGKPPKPKVIPGVDGKAKPSKVNNRKCRGCKKYFGPEGMSAGKNFCHIDNRALDNIRRLMANKSITRFCDDFNIKHDVMSAIRYSAAKQGKIDWYNRMRADDTKVEIALMEYFLRFPDLAGDFAGSGKKRTRVPAAVTFQVLEYVIASTKDVVLCVWKTNDVQSNERTSGRMK